MKRILLWITLLALALSLCACGRKEEQEAVQTPEATEETVARVDFETQLRLDAFPQGDELMEMVGQAVTFRDITDQGDRITFTVQAPDISQALIDWYDAQELADEAAMTEKIRELLQGGKAETPITLEYEVGYDGTVHFSYTEEYLNAAGCGLRQFYAHYYEALMEQLGGNGDE